MPDMPAVDNTKAAMLGATVRTIIVGLGGFAVGAGYMTSDDLTHLADSLAAMVGAGSIVVGLVWSLIQKHRTTSEIKNLKG